MHGSYSFRRAMSEILTEKIPVGILKSNIEKEGVVMISFVNSFLSYVMLMLVIVVLSGCAVAVGLFLRKKKNAKNEQVHAVSETTEE